MGLVALVVGDAAVRDVDADPLHGDLAAPAGLADGDDNIRLNRRDLLPDHRDGFPADSGHFQFDDIRAGNGVRQPLDGFNGRIDRFAAEGIKACDKYFHSVPPFIFMTARMFSRHTLAAVSGLSLSSRT